MRVLIVDDEPSILTSTAALLRDMDYDVATCSDATKVRDALERVMPDVLLQDVRMPGLDLEKLVFSLRADPRWKNLAIVLFTASMDIEEVAERIGIEAVLPKPFTPRELTAILDQAAPAFARA